MKIEKLIKKIKLFFNTRNEKTTKMDKRKQQALLRILCR